MGNSKKKLTKRGKKKKAKFKIRVSHSRTSCIMHEVSSFIYILMVVEDVKQFINYSFLLSQKTQQNKAFHFLKQWNIPPPSFFPWKFGLLCLGWKSSNLEVVQTVAPLSTSLRYTYIHIYIYMCIYIYILTDSVTWVASYLDGKQKNQITKEFGGWDFV